MCFGNVKKQIMIIVLLYLLSFGAQASCVILLHGLVRSDYSMSKLEMALTQEEFKVINVDYPSRKYPIEELAEITIKPALSKCEDEKINFVTHSLGGILVRQYLSEHEVKNLSRVVMLGPPNHGSEVVDKLKNVPGFYFINGDAGLQLGTDENSILNKLGPATFDLGVIAGNSSLNFLFSPIIPGADDGTVSVESTKLEGMSDHIEMPVSHTFMMRNEQVIQQAIHYLKYGQFKRQQKQ